MGLLRDETGTGTHWVGSGDVGRECAAMAPNVWWSPSSSVAIALACAAATGPAWVTAGGGAEPAPIACP